MRLVIERLPHAAFILLTWVASVQGFVVLYEALGLGGCGQLHLLSFSCGGASTTQSTQLACLIITGAVLTVILIIRRFFHRNVAAPFAYFILSTLAISSLVDAVFNPHIAHLNTMFSDSYYVISFIISISFIIISFVIERVTDTYFKFFAACIVSHLCKMVAFLICAIFHVYFDGMLALFMLFFVFSFGCFSLHIMSVVSIFDDSMTASGVPRSRLPPG